MKLNIPILIILLTISASAFSQGLYDPKSDDGLKGVVYNKEFTVDFRAHTNGVLALAANFGKIKTYYKTRYYQIEIGEIRHPKEFRYPRDIISAGSSRSTGPYVYGKQNSLFTLRAAMGQKRYYSEKASRRGLAIGINYAGGPTLGIIKPYYLEVYSSDNNNSSFRTIRYSDEEAFNFLNEARIARYSGFVKGLDEISVAPGINAKFGVHFDWGAFDEFVKAVEVGIMADVFFKKIPIMIDDITVPLNTIPPSTLDITPQAVGNRPFFINFYIAVQLGKRY